MSAQSLHIVSFSIPWPPNFGGAIDIFYKLKALNKLGVKITFHCFTYTPEETPELNKYCEKIYYYPIKTGFLNHLSPTPFIVRSRHNSLLLERLTKDNYPILFEGLHTTSFLGHPALKDRQQWVRTHNIEHDYYNSLSRAEGLIHKKLFLKFEAWKLKQFSAHLSTATGIMAISQRDASILKNSIDSTYLIPAFHGYSQVSSKTGKGDYILYHGDLSVPENSRSAEIMIDTCKELPFHLVIAGKSPDNHLKNLIKQHHSAEIIENPDTEKMEELICNAGVILLPAKQTTGLRLKLLISLFTGRHCIASPQIVKDTGLEKLCHIAVDKDEWQQTIKLCMNTPFTAHHKEQRQEPLKNYLDIANAGEIKKLIFKE